MIYGSIRTNTFSSIGFAINASKNGKMSVPVSSSNYIYSQFKHISGIRAPDGVRGVTINKIKILDSLIEHMQTKKLQEPATVSVSDEYLNALIEQYKTQIRQTMLTSTASTYNTAPIIPTGMIFDLVA